MCECPAEYWLIIARSVHFGTCLLLASVWIFDRLLVEKGVRHLYWLPVAWRLMVIAAPLAIFSALVWFLAVTVNMSDQPISQALTIPIMKVVWTQTQFGELWQLHLALLLLTAALATTALATRSGLFAWLSLIASASVVVTLAWAGHGQTGKLPQLHLPADALHLLIASFWPTGLLPFACLLHRVRKMPDHQTNKSISRLTNRFSAMSLISVAGLAITGTINSIFLVGSFGNLWTIPYGQVLLIKIGLYLMMIGIGAVNLLRLKPRLAGGAQNDVSPNRAAKRLQLNVWFEVTLAAAVIVVVSILGLMAPGTG
jgi:copper resistance protein D